MERTYDNNHVYIVQCMKEPHLSFAKTLDELKMTVTRQILSNNIITRTMLCDLETMKVYQLKMTHTLKNIYFEYPATYYEDIYELTLKGR